MMNKIKKLMLKIIIKLKEKNYKSNGTQLKYLFFKETGENLIVIFSAYNKDVALYNYLKTLKNYKCSKLYIKDDFGPSRTGSYYLGEHGKKNVEPTVIKLIREKLCAIEGINSNIIFVGSSKGGYAALNFAVEFENSIAIVGAPQYKLGTHLNEPFFYPMLEDIIGNRTSGKIKNLDDHIKNKYINMPKGLNQQIFIQYSPVEWSDVFRQYTYKTHIEPFIQDVRKYTDIQLNEERVFYKEHNDVHKYFPSYLCTILSNLINKR